MKKILYYASIIVICIAIYSLNPLQWWSQLFQQWLQVPTGSSRFPVTNSMECVDQAYTVRIMSHDPLIIHLENFFTTAESEHLLSISSSLLKRSSVTLKNGTEIMHPQRTSSSAFIPRDDNIARSIQNRVSKFQGYFPVTDIERLQVTTYQKSQEYRDHYDWFGLDAERSRDRITTFFGILEADCDNCGTHFPLIKVDWRERDERWCQFVDCSASTLTVKPVVNSALFWTNLHSNGTGDKRMLHAGQPLTRGIKTGLNIWSQQEYPRTQERFA